MSEKSRTDFDKKWTEDEAARKAAIADYRRRLAALDLDGPIDLRGGMDAFSLLAGSQSVAVCLKCGVMVLLGDMMERDEGTPIERGVFLHTKWHAENAPQPEG